MSSAFSSCSLTLLDNLQRGYGKEVHAHNNSELTGKVTCIRSRKLQHLGGISHTTPTVRFCVVMHKCTWKFSLPDISD